MVLAWYCLNSVVVTKIMSLVVVMMSWLTGHLLQKSLFQHWSLLNGKRDCSTLSMYIMIFAMCCVIYVIYYKHRVIVQHSACILLYFPRVALSMSYILWYVQCVSSVTDMLQLNVSSCPSYTHDEGQTWQNFVYKNDSMRVDAVLNDPGAATRTVVWVDGSQTTSQISAPTDLIIELVLIIN